MPYADLSYRPYLMTENYGIFFAVSLIRPHSHQLTNMLTCKLPVTNRQVTNHNGFTKRPEF